MRRNTFILALQIMIVLAVAQAVEPRKLKKSKDPTINQVNESIYPEKSVDFELNLTPINKPLHVLKSTQKLTGSAGEEKNHALRKRQAERKDELHVLQCGKSCHCYTVNKTIYSDEFRVVCNNTGNDLVLLSSAVFENEGAPTMNRQVYVRVEDVVGIVVTSDFVARWTAYTSCAMDLGRVGDIVLPSGPIERAPTEAYSFVFAGLGIKESRLTHIPYAMISDVDEYGIDLVNVSITKLNIYNLVHPRSKTLRYLNLTDVNLGSIVSEGAEQSSEDSETCCQINMKEAWAVKRKKLDGVWITNSNIGVVESNGLSLTSEEKMTFSVENSRIGVVKPDGIRLGGSVAMRMVNSSVNLEPGALVIEGSEPHQMVNNRLIITKSTLAEWECTENDISGNKVVVVADVEAKESNTSNREEETDYPEDPEDFQGIVEEEVIDPTCLENNEILNIRIKNEPESLFTTLNSTDTSSTTVPTVFLEANESFAETLDGLNSTDQTGKMVDERNLEGSSENYFHIRKGIIYLVIAGVCFLVIIVLVLSIVLVCRQGGNGRRKGEPVRDRQPSLMYMPGSSVYGNDTWPIPSTNTFSMT